MEHATRLWMANDSLLNIDAMAQVCWPLHQRARSAWAHESELRPWTESF